MDNSGAGNDDSRSISPDAIHSSNKRSREEADGGGSSSTEENNSNDVSSHEETVKRIRIAFPNCNDQLVTLLERISSDDERQVIEVLEQLFNIFKQETKQDETTVAFIRLGGHINLVHVMKKHRNCREIQELACLNIQIICVLNRNINIHAVGGIGSIATSFCVVGALDRIEQCFQKFQRDERVVQIAVATCNDLVVHALAQSVPLFLESIGIHLLVEIMKEFPNNETIQEHGCRIMRYCMEHCPTIIESLKHAGAMSVVGAVLDHFPDESEANKKAKRFMKVVAKK